jgi:hypothetical protein
MLPLFHWSGDVCYQRRSFSLCRFRRVRRYHLCVFVFFYDYLHLPSYSTDQLWRLGDEVPLGILSAWEPCGGILCANLPIVYRTLIREFKYIKDTIKTSHSQGMALHGSQRPAERSSQTDWVQLDSSSTAAIHSDSVTGNCTHKGVDFNTC